MKTCKEKALEWGVSPHSVEDTSKYFADKAIWKCGEEYRSHQGKYPVIFLTFKYVKFDNWNDTIGKIRGLLQEEYGRHQELMNSDKISRIGVMRQSQYMNTNMSSYNSVRKM